MANPFSRMDAALGAIAETLVWREDQSPHLTGTFRGIVLQGSPESANAGNPLAPVTADSWTVTVCGNVGLVTQMVEGDTVQLVDRPGQPTLFVQEVIRTEIGWWLKCTADERSPV